MKKVVIAVVAIAVLVSMNVTYAKSRPNGRPFQAIWQELDSRGSLDFSGVSDDIQELRDWIRDLTTKTNNHIDSHEGGEGSEGPEGPIGPQGPAGPDGPQGPRGISGAGNIAFIDDDGDVLYTLTTDLSVWERASSTWTDMNRDIASTTPTIVQWEIQGFLDETGDIWEWTGSAWSNIQHP